MHSLSPSLISGMALLLTARLPASPILTLPVFDPSQYEIVGDFQLSQSGNAITGDYQLNLPPPEPGNTDYTVVESGNEILGDFKLVETPSSYPDQQEFNAQLESSIEYQMNQSGNQVLGDFTLMETGNAITGDYQLASPLAPKVPEPATVSLFGAGAGLVAISRILKRRQFVRPAR